MAPVAAPVRPSVDDVTAGLKVIDCDAHITEAPDHWTRHAPAALRSRMPQLRRVDGQDHWFIDGLDFGTVGTSVVSRDGSKIAGKISHDRFDDMSLASSNAKARVAVLDDLGIWAQIEYPNAAGFQTGKFMQVQDPELRLACVRAYNDGIAEIQRDSGNRVLPQALIPIWDRAETVRELRRVREELKLTGITIGDKPEQFGIPGYLDDYWSPFWEYCNANRVPINFHIGGAVGVDAFKAPWDAYGFERNVAIAATLFYMSNAATMANFLLSGLFDKYRDLKMVSVESGLSWVPFVLEALEYQLDEMIPTECKHLERRPKQYFRDHFLVCFWFETFGPKHMIDEIGAENILFMTDYPHPTCLYPQSREHLAKVAAGWSPYVRRRILQDNAAELYGIDVSA
jgi:predicted TIM-barrel fold metal-dependent hydrolase